MARKFSKQQNDFRIDFFDIKCSRIKKKDLQVDIVITENYKAENTHTQKNQDSAVGSTVFHEARRSVNFVN